MTMRTTTSTYENHSMLSLVHEIREHADPTILEDFSVNLEEQRESVTRLLNTGETVYGHNTLLGHLDDTASVAQDQAVLLDAHLLGTPSVMSPEEFNTITIAKTVQLAQGGTGISPETFSVLLDQIMNPVVDPVAGVWDASYGSGDVVPSTYWVNHILGDTIRAGDLPAGDFIALINGTGYATGRSIYLVEQAVRVLGDILGIVYDHSDTRYYHDHRGQGQGRSSALSVQGVQLPVSLRDPSPLFSLVQDTITTVYDAIENSLSRPSSNPLFLFDDEKGARSYSQSSFLDYRLSHAIRVLGHTVIVSAQWLTRVIQHLADHIENNGNPVDTAWTVQYPKIATAYAHQVRGLHPAPVEMISTSHGIEDIADGTVQAITAVTKQLYVLVKIVDLYEVINKNS